LRTINKTFIIAEGLLGGGLWPTTVTTVCATCSGRISFARTIGERIYAATTIGTGEQLVSLHRGTAGSSDGDSGIDLAQERCDWYTA
jgi:hypothetical protein